MNAGAARQRLFSIVIPTHDRLPILLDSLKTIIGQDYDNWEVFVFDNASHEPVADALAALGDARIHCARSDEFLPVTASWNRAIDMARGEYVTLIGDDDGLAPGFFGHINALVEQFDEPDLIFSSLLQFIHPGVNPVRSAGYVADLPMADFLEGRSAPFVLEARLARKAVDDSLALRRSFMFNMSAFTAHRSLIARIRQDGVVFLSPFPDYYFANVAFDAANKIVAEPGFLAFQGVSGTSFGFTLLNNRTDDGFKVLNHDVERDAIYKELLPNLLPGPRYNSEYVVTMNYVAKMTNRDQRQIDMKRYRRIQILHTIRQKTNFKDWIRSSEGRAFMKSLSLFEKSWVFMFKVWVVLFKKLEKFESRRVSVFSRAARGVSRTATRSTASLYRWAPIQNIYHEGKYTNLSDVFFDLRDGVFWQSAEPDH